MAAAVDAIRSEHRTMAILLDLLEQQVDAFEQTARPDYDLMKEIIDYFLTFPDLYHHPKEDLIFRKMKARDPEEIAKFGDLEEQHDKVSKRLHAFTHAVVNVMLEAEMPRDAFVELAREFISGERKHMQAEESIFLPAALKSLTEQDWDEIDGKVREFTDPLAHGVDGSRFVLLREQLDKLGASPA